MYRTNNKYYIYINNKYLIVLNLFSFFFFLTAANIASSLLILKDYMN